MRMWEYMEKRAASMKTLQGAFRKTVKPFRVKGQGDYFMPEIGKIELSGSGFKGESPKVQRAQNLIVGLHEGTERKTKEVGKGFNGHHAPSVITQDFVRINRMDDLSPAEKRTLRSKGSGGLVRNSEFNVLKSRVPSMSRELQALQDGETHLDGRRLFNRHARKRLDREYANAREVAKKRVGELESTKRRLNDRDGVIRSRLNRVVTKADRGSRRGDYFMKQEYKAGRLEDPWERVEKLRQSRYKRRRRALVLKKKRDARSTERNTRMYHQINKSREGIGDPQLRGSVGEEAQKLMGLRKKPKKSIPYKGK